MPFVTLTDQQIPTDLGLSMIPPIFYQRYDQRDNDDDPAVLLLHGAGGTYLGWPPQLRRLQRALVYAIDLPGHGQSEPLPLAEDKLAEGSSVGIGAYSAIVHALIKAWALKKVILIGHSMGGAVALTCALAEINTVAMAVQGLVLVDSGARLPVNQRIFRDLETDFAAMTAKLVDWMYAPGLSDRHRERAVEALRQNPLAQLLADFHACNSFDVSNQVAQLRLPTLILCGELDKMTPLASSQHLATAIPTSRLELIPASGHMAMLEAPTTVTEVVQRFIDEQRDPSSAALRGFSGKTD